MTFRKAISSATFSPSQISTLTTSPVPNANQPNSRMLHAAWQPLVAFFSVGGIKHLRRGSHVVTTILQNPNCPKDGQGMSWQKPDDFRTGTAGLSWTLPLPPAGSSSKRIRAISNRVVLSTMGAKRGLDFGFASWRPRWPATRLELPDAG